MRMQVVFQASFACQNRFALTAFVDAIGRLFPTVCLGRQFVIVEVELGQIQSSETVTPRPHMPAAEGNEDQATTIIQFRKIG